MKEMVGGCCVCSDERGWPENPLVYCDGQNCTVAVHQACYGIVTVPTGPWYCRKCESQERSARVRCELCPSKNGALKKTDNQGWAHVVCALYIPEVRFGNVTTMEPIILSLIPTERYAKACYICQESGKGGRANAGACMQCNKTGCKQQFHVTCAQALGLLCEEAGNYLDNVKYCGYCQYHYSKLKKGGNVKTIPPYKPVTHETNSSDATSSPEKELEPSIVVTATSSATTIKITSVQSSGSVPSSSSSSSSSSSKQRKSSSTSKLVTSSSTSSSNPGSSNVPSSANSNALSSSTSSTSKSNPSSSSSSKEKDKHSKSLNKVKNQEKESSSSSSSSSTRDKTKSSKTKDISDHGSSSSLSNIPQTNSANISTSSAGIQASSLSSSKESAGQKFSSTNFSDNVVINSDSVFNSNEQQQSTSQSQTTSTSSKNSSSSSSSFTKKRKSDSSKSGSGDSVEQNSSHLPFRNIIKDVSVTLVPLPMDKADLADSDRTSKKPKPETSPPLPQSNSEPNLQNVSPNLMGTQSGVGISIKQHQNLQQSVSSLQNQSSNGNSSVSLTKQPILKDTVETSRHRSNSPYSSSTAALGNSNAATPSLYVSVPLSTATVPGVNLPSTTSNDNVAQAQLPNRASPHVNHHSHSHHHSSSNSSSSSNNVSQQLNILERQSPRQAQNLSTGSASISHLSDGNVLSQISHSSSNNSSVIQPSISPVSNSVSAVIGGTSASVSTMESGALKITYEKQNMRTSHLHEDEIPGRRSRTPDSGVMFSGTNSSFSNSGGLKFSYEPQTNPVVQPISPPDASSQSAIKESPPSSPGSESGLSRKRKRKSTDSKDNIKLFHNGVHATHMLGNQLNPNSSVAQKMSDQLTMEIEAHSVYAQPIDAGPPLVGIPFPGKPSVRPSTTSNGPTSLNSMLSGSGGSGPNGNAPQSLEQLLERQWEQGSQFLMEQAQHFDIASLLSCLHQLRTENVRLEEHINNLIARRDHLLAVNARLAIPLNPNVPHNPNSLNTMHLNGPTTDNSAPGSATSTASTRLSRQSGGHYNAQPQPPPPTSAQTLSQSSPQIPIENGIDFRHSSHQTTSNPSNLSHN